MKHFGLIFKSAGLGFLLIFSFLFPKITQAKLWLNDIPFTSQAPLAQWSDDRFQDACEEASVLMAMATSTADKKIRTAQIISLVNFETKNYNNYHDTSASDTALRLLKGYYGYSNYQIKKNVTPSDLISAIKKGQVIIAPTDGRALKNPNFTAPGPERHMLVIIGYDDLKKIFITNDPGTRNGEHYKYSEKILFNALRDYPTGYKVKISKTEKTVIIVTRPSKKP